MGIRPYGRLVCVLISLLITSAMWSIPVQGDEQLYEETQNYVLGNGFTIWCSGGQPATEFCIGGAVFSDIPEGRYSIKIQDAYWNPVGGSWGVCLDDECFDDYNPFCGDIVLPYPLGPAIELRVWVENPFHGSQNCGFVPSIGIEGIITIQQQG